MALRRTILCIGDNTAEGRPVADLTAIDPNYTQAQADFITWNIQSQAWQNLTPGTNSNTRPAASDLWSWESHLREGLRATFPTETLYLIKDASAGDLSAWSPQDGALYSSLLDEVTAAALSASAAGDELSIDGIVISVQTLELLGKTWRSYGTGLNGLVEYLRSNLGAITDVTMGTVRADGSPTPVVVVEPHYAHYPSDGRLQHIRMQAESLENEDTSVRVLRCHGYAADATGPFSAAAAVSMGADIASYLLPAAFSDEGRPEATVVGLFGDSTVEGFGPSNASLPEHLQAVITGAQIWSPFTGSFAPLQAGINNQISIPTIPGFPLVTFHGYEISLAERLRDDHNVWIVKGTQINSIAADYRGRLGAVTPPTFDTSMISWGAGRDGLCDLYIRGYLRSAIDSLRAQGKKPVMGLQVIGLGTNDAIFPRADYRMTRAGIMELIGLIRETATKLEVDTSAMRFVCVVPPDYAKDAEVPYDTIVEADLNAIRNDLLELPTMFDDVYTVDMSSHDASDYIHPSVAGNVTIAKAIYDTYKSTTANDVQPLFVPTMLALKKALRLSDVSQDNDALAMIDNAAMSAKARMFGRLGEQKIAELQALTYTTNPTSTADYLRITAVETEIKLVRAELLRSMPTQFMDGSSQTQSWNEEGAFRQGSYLQTKDEIKRLQAEVEVSLGMLSRAELGGSVGSVSTFPESTNALPGDTTFKVI